MQCVRVAGGARSGGRRGPGVVLSSALPVRVRQRPAGRTPRRHGRQLGRLAAARQARLARRHRAARRRRLRRPHLAAPRRPADPTPALHLCYTATVFSSTSRYCVFLPRDAMLAWYSLSSFDLSVRLSKRLDESSWFSAWRLPYFTYPTLCYKKIWASLKLGYFSGSFSGLRKFRRGKSIALSTQEAQLSPRDRAMRRVN